MFMLLLFTKINLQNSCGWLKQGWFNPLPVPLSIACPMHLPVNQKSTLLFLTLHYPSLSSAQIKLNIPIFLPFISPERPTLVFSASIDAHPAAYSFPFQTNTMPTIHCHFKWHLLCPTLSVLEPLCPNPNMHISVLAQNWLFYEGNGSVHCTPLSSKNLNNYLCI